MTPEQRAVVEWFEDPSIPTPSAEEVVERFRAAGVRSPGHALEVVREVKEMTDTTQAGGKPSKGTPADKRIKENKPKK